MFLLYYYYTPWKRQKISAFLMFSGGTEIERRLEMGYCTLHRVKNNDAVLNQINKSTKCLTNNFEHVITWCIDLFT